jgi:hypothetical protein
MGAFDCQDPNVCGECGMRLIVGGAYLETSHCRDTGCPALSAEEAWHRVCQHRADRPGCVNTRAIGVRQENSLFPLPTTEDWEEAATVMKANLEAKAKAAQAAEAQAAEAQAESDPNAQPGEITLSLENQFTLQQHRNLVPNLPREELEAQYLDILLLNMLQMEAFRSMMRLG